MDEEGLRGLEDSENWDFDKAEKRPPARANRVVVSVSLSRDEFEQIGKCAESMRTRTSTFIRKAALDATKHETKSSVFITGGGLGGSILASAPSWTTAATGTEALALEELKPSATY